LNPIINLFLLGFLYGKEVNKVKINSFGSLLLKRGISSFWKKRFQFPTQ